MRKIMRNIILVISLFTVMYGYIPDNRSTSKCGELCPFCLHGECKEYIGHFGYHRCYHCGHMWRV